MDKSSELAQWKVLQVITGQEAKIKKLLDENMELYKESMVQVIAPVRKVAVQSLRKRINEPVIPSYVFVKCILTSQLYYFLRNIPSVYGILDGVVTEEEMQRLLPHLESVGELALTDRSILDNLKQRFKELILSRRKNKLVIRLPLKQFFSLLKSYDVLASTVTETKLFQLLRHGPIPIAV